MAFSKVPLSSKVFGIAINLRSVEALLVLFASTLALRFVIKLMSVVLLMLVLLAFMSVLAFVSAICSSLLFQLNALLTWLSTIVLSLSKWLVVSESLLIEAPGIAIPELVVLVVVLMLLVLMLLQ
jgi:hypothetical protein